MQTVLLNVLFIISMANFFLVVTKQPLWEGTCRCNSGTCRCTVDVCTDVIQVHVDVIHVMDRKKVVVTDVVEIVFPLLIFSFTETAF